MKFLSGYAILILVMMLEWAAHVLVFLARVTSPVRRIVRQIRMKVLMWRANRLCRNVSRKQKLLSRLLNRYGRLEDK